MRSLRCCSDCSRRAISAADPVVAALHGAEALVAVGELDTQLLDGGFGGALRRNGGLERDLLLAERMLLLGDFGSQARSIAARAARR